MVKQVNKWMPLHGTHWRLTGGSSDATKGTLGAYMPDQPPSEITFWHELVSGQPKLIKSTCARCFDSTTAPTFELLEEWEREHNCSKTLAKLSLLRRLRSWLSFSN